MTFRVLGEIRMSDKDDLIQELFVCATDLLTEAAVPGYTVDEQQRLKLQVKALRDRRMRLRKMKFDQHTASYADTIAGIDAVTDEMDKSIDRINDLVSFFGLTAMLVAAVDRLIASAVPGA
jgi:hypothetical protein